MKIIKMLLCLTVVFTATANATEVTATNEEIRQCVPFATSVADKYKVYAHRVKATVTDANVKLAFEYALGVCVQAHKTKGAETLDLGDI